MSSQPVAVASLVFLLSLLDLAHARLDQFSCQRLPRPQPALYSRGGLSQYHANVTMKPFNSKDDCFLQVSCEGYGMCSLESSEGDVLSQVKKSLENKVKCSTVLQWIGGSWYKVKPTPRIVTDETLLYCYVPNPLPLPSIRAQPDFMKYTEFNADPCTPYKNTVNFVPSTSENVRDLSSKMTTIFFYTNNQCYMKVECIGKNECFLASEQVLDYKARVNQHATCSRTFRRNEDGWYDVKTNIRHNSLSCYEFPGEETTTTAAPVASALSSKQASSQHFSSFLLIPAAALLLFFFLCSCW